MPALIISDGQFCKFHGVDFEDQDQVGWGFSGLVLKSLHRPSNQIFARKIIHETPRKRKELQVSRKEAEFYERIAANLTPFSGNIVKCFGVMPVGGVGHIHGGLVFEYMDAGSLADHQQFNHHRPLPEPMVLYIAENLLKACSVLESLGIVHRDIKPSNILFNRRGEVKLCDFGEACYRWESESKLCGYGRMVGSTAYMSPERLSGQGHCHSADIWSVGLVILEATMSNFPFSSSCSTSQPSSDCSIIELWETVMETDSLPSVCEEGYSVQLRNFVNLCMQKDPNSRPSASQLLSSFSKLFLQKATTEQFIDFIKSS